MKPVNTEADLREPFEAHAAMTVGIEEEVMLLDAATLDLLGEAASVLELLREDSRFKRELPTSQVEIVSGPHARVGAAAAEIADARTKLRAIAAGTGVLAGAGVHPFAAPRGELNHGPVYDWARREYGAAAQLQMVCGLHVHVAVPGAERARAVYNELRAHLPELIALSANSPFYAGSDTGFASVRHMISGLLPRQGVPPEIPSWARFSEDLRWGVDSGMMASAGQWWWGVRLNVVQGTIEVRCFDTQSAPADTAALAAVVHCLCAELAARHDAGDLREPVAAWRIAGSAWSAARWGVEGTLVSFDGPRGGVTRDRIAELVERLEPRAEELGCAPELAAALALASRNGALMTRDAVRGAPDQALAATRWLAGRFSG